MARTYHLKCPACGGLLSSRGERVLACKYCGERSLVLIPDWMPSCYLKPRLDIVGARRAMVSLFKNPDVETGMLKTAHLESAELFFVPLYHLQARRVGSFLVKPQSQNLRQSQRQVIANSSSLTYHESWKEVRALEKLMNQKPDTKIIISDVHRSVPAVRVEEWGLDSLDPERIVLDAKSGYQAYNREQMDRMSTVLEPAVSAEERVDQIFKMNELISTDQTEIVDRRIDLVYYPVFRMRWRYQQKSFATTIDAITGQLLFARAPARQRARVLWLLLVSAAVGFSAGKILATLKFFIITGVFGLSAMFILATILLFFVAFGWNMFRYSAELVLQTDNVSVEFIGRPPETIFEKMAGKMGEVMIQAFKRRNNYSGWRG